MIVQRGKYSRIVNRMFVNASSLCHVVGKPQDRLHGTLWGNIADANDVADQTFVAAPVNRRARWVASRSVVE